jgi:hypothetical protein
MDKFDLNFNADEECFCGDCFQVEIEDDEDDENDA